MGIVAGPRVAIPSFLNQYSYNFDGVNDYVDTAITNTGTNDISISCWIKTTETFVYTDKRCAFGGYNNGSGANYTLGILGSGFATPNDMQVRVFNTLGTTKLNDGNWHNIIYTHDYTTKETKAYVDGNITPEVTTTIAAWSTNFKIAIGWDGITSSYHFNGNVDECAYWENIISASDITSIYNSGTPNDLTSLNPVAWWRMGENGAYKSPQWLIPNNENKDKISNYSFEFDGVSDYIDCGDSNETEGITTLSISGWFKPNSGGVGGASGIVAKDFVKRDFYVGWFSVPTNSIRFWISDDDGVTNDNVNSLTLGTNANVLNKWHHFVCTWNAVDKLKIYINGVLSNETNSVNANSALPSSTNILEIGRRVSTYFNGNIDNVSLYNSELSQSDVTNIYNGGTPTTISGAISHWKMGENATYVENVNPDGTWTIPDEVGTSVGTSYNLMADSARVGEAPGSSNNALSFNMDLIDRVEDTPPT